MAPTQRAPAIDESEEDSKIYDWDGSALTRHPWAKHLAKRCYKRDTRFRQHIEYGYHMSGHKTIVQSTDHSHNLYDRNVNRSLWADPACLGHWQYTSGTTSGIVIPTDEGKDYTVSLHDCEQIDISLIEFILSTITDDSERQDMEDACHNDARTLILNIQAYTPPEEVGTWAVTKRQHIVAAGILAPNTKAFNTFRTWYTMYNEQSSSPDPEAVASTVYMTAVRKLGQHISGQLDYELLRTAAGTNRVKIIAAIKTVLTRQDATTSTGQALRVTPGHDPRRNTPATAPEERKWVEGHDEPCSLCINAPLDIGGSGPGSRRGFGATPGRPRTARRLAHTCPEVPRPARSRGGLHLQ